MWYKSRFNSMPVSRLVSKHILSAENDKLIADAVGVGYENIIFGANKGHSIQDTIKQIKRMAKDRTFNRPVVIVETSNGCAWCDTTHTALAYMLRYHDAVTLGEVNHIIIDYTKGAIPLVDGYWVNDSFNETEKSCLLSEAYLHSLKLEERAKKGFRKNMDYYTINHLYKELSEYMTPWGRFIHRKQMSVPCQKLSELLKAKSGENQSL